jgi:hypothetical protein
MKLGKRGGFFLTVETIKWSFYSAFIAIVAVIFVIGVNMYLHRDVDSESLEMFLAKERFIEAKFGDEKISSETLQDLEDYENEEPNLGILVNVDEDKYYSNKHLYGEKGFCQIDNSKRICMDYPLFAFYLVDGELKEVTIDMVMLNA